MVEVKRKYNSSYLPDVEPMVATNRADAGHIIMRTGSTRMELCLLSKPALGHCYEPNVSLSKDGIVTTSIVKVLPLDCVSDTFG